MEVAYRSAGVTVALGRSPIAYTEACCVGACSHALRYRYIGIVGKGANISVFSREKR
jgi:hypothetical protein